MPILELQKPAELMALYQAVMAGKFADGAEDLLLSQPLADVANRLVDTLLDVLQSSHNQPMIEAMQASRELRQEYPQYPVLLRLMQSEAVRGCDMEQVRRMLETAAAPLWLPESLLQQLLEYAIDDEC